MFFQLVLRLKNAINIFIHTVYIMYMSIYEYILYINLHKINARGTN